MSWYRLVQLIVSIHWFPLGAAEGRKERSLTSLRSANGPRLRHDAPTCTRPATVVPAARSFGQILAERILELDGPIIQQVAESERTPDAAS